jgi:hypothetical protein
MAPRLQAKHDVAEDRRFAPRGGAVSLVAMTVFLR